MRFILEVVDDEFRKSWLTKPFEDLPPREGRLVAVLSEDERSITGSVLRAPLLDEIPDNALVRIRRID